MNPEQIEEMRRAVASVKETCSEVELLISDYLKCESEMSRKYLGAAIKKHASGIAAGLKPELFG